MSEYCPTCAEEEAAGPAHALRLPRLNTNTGREAPAELAACPSDDDSGAPACHDGYRIPLVVALATAPAICATVDVKSPCADRWAYPGLLAEIYPLGFVEVTAVSGDWVTVKNLTIAEDAPIGVGLTIRPIPRAPDALNAFSVADEDVQNPANFELGALSQDIRFPVGVPAGGCGNRWKTAMRRGMCGMPLATAKDVSPLLVALWNPLTGCFHFLPPGIEGDGLVIKGGVPAWFHDTTTRYVFEYTGAQQFLEVPAGFTQAQIKQWGAGGSTDGGIPGGVGGFTRVIVPVTPGDILSIIVGQGVHNFLGRTFGFGGSGQGEAHQHNGGGLSGVFTAVTAVTSADFARALSIAGGGGAAGQSGGGSNAVYGGNGNGTAGAGEADMQGADSFGGLSSGGGGGGGGYRGGSNQFLGGYGGSGFAALTATEQEILGAGLVVATDPPRTTDPDYKSGVGRQGEPGLVVINFIA